jgi:MoxR-like ATPase
VSIFRLEKGETVWKDGPVVEAMKRGAVLLLDEVDLASTKIMCLQPVLEGKAIYLKKINVLVKPTEGFTVVATANTKGRGSEDGRFMGTGILNEAFLDRFSTTFFQEYAKKDTEVKILVATCTRVGIKPEIEFINLLTDWAETIREAQSNGSIEDTISTRRLVNIIEAYSIFGNQGEAVKLSVERFEDETKESFLDFYKKLLPNEEMVNDFGKNEV